MRTHKRLIDVLEPNPQDGRVADAQLALPAGVDIEMKL